MARFSVRFLGCKVSHTDARAVRERLLHDGHTEVEGGGDVAVVNTCCVTNEALAKSRQAAARAARTHRRVFVTGCGAHLSETAFAGLPDNVTVDARLADLREAPLPRADLALVNISTTALAGLAGPLEVARAITSGYLLSDDPALPGFARERRIEVEGWAADVHVRL